MIWIQWFISHLVDKDCVAFIRRCIARIKPGGFLELNENNCKRHQKVEIDGRLVSDTLSISRKEARA